MAAQIAITIMINKTIITNPAEIHRGLVTHHHDQSIVWVSFKIKNTINNTVPNSKPLLVVIC